ncbi:MAG TPA: DUF6644 family protein [Burkholderiales bacterium]|nr:DUF6644 family protein [Burkholderiales bacterium]
MHEIAGPALLVWLETSGLALAMRQWQWLYPIVEIAHIAGIVLLVGAVAMFDLRLLGFSRSLPVQQMARHLLPWSVTGLALVAITGLMMFTAHATEFFENPAFILKIILIVVGGVNALLFHNGVYREVHRWNMNMEAPFSAKVSAFASLVLWVGVIACGRLLAYF